MHALVTTEFRSFIIIRPCSLSLIIYIYTTHHPCNSIVKEAKHILVCQPRVNSKNYTEHAWSIFSIHLLQKIVSCIWKTLILIQNLPWTMLCLQELGYGEKHHEKFSVHLPNQNRHNKPVSNSNTRITEGTSYLNQKNIKIANFMHIMIGRNADYEKWKSAGFTHQGWSFRGIGVFIGIKVVFRIVFFIVNGCQSLNFFESNQPPSQ